MMKLKQMIKNEYEKDNQLAARLAKLAGYEKVNGFYKFVNTPDKEMDNLGGLIKIVKSLFSEKEEQLLGEYFLQLDPNKKCARQSVEYSDINQWDSLTDKIILNLCSSKNATSQEWGNIYNIHRKLNKSELGLNDAIRETGKCKIKTPEMLFFSNAMLMYEYLNIGEFGLMKSTAKLLDFDELPDGFIKDSYASRVALLKANIYLNDNDLEKSRFYSKEVITKTDIERLKVFGYLTYGNTLIFESYDKAKESYELGRTFVKRNKHHDYKLRLALCFLNNVWNKENQWVDFNSNLVADQIEVAYYYTNKKQYDKAISVISSLEKRDLYLYDAGILDYIKGLIYQEKSYFYESTAKLKKSGDKMFINLPLGELKKMGCDENLLELILI
ncbi:AimR family lysis-lysogeny pheromone receptor [Bacillus subtilis subsp. subtilis]